MYIEVEQQRSFDSIIICADIKFFPLKPNANLETLYMASISAFLYILKPIIAGKKRKRQKKKTKRRKKAGFLHSTYFYILHSLHIPPHAVLNNSQNIHSHCICSPHTAEKTTFETYFSKHILISSRLFSHQAFKDCFR